MNEIEARFSGKCDRYELFTGSKSERNIGLHRKLGYRVFREERVGESLTMVFMERSSGALNRRPA